jgi:uncharacterized protein DUF4345
MRPIRETEAVGQSEIGDASSRRAFRSLIRLGGLVATAAGVDTVVRGARSVPAQTLANPSVESELRFYAAFYVATGLVALRVAPRADRDSTTVRALAGALFLAGLGRVIAWRHVGAPHHLQRVLLAIELTAPPAIVAWQGRLSARTEEASRS